MLDMLKAIQYCGYFWNCFARAESTNAQTPCKPGVTPALLAVKQTQEE